MQDEVTARASTDATAHSSGRVSVRQLGAALLEWFSRRRAIAAATDRPAVSPAFRERLAQGLAAATLADQVRTATGARGATKLGLEGSSASTFAIQLYALAIRWALSCASADARLVDLAESFEPAPSDELVRAARGDTVRLAAIRRALLERSPVAALELEARERDADAAAVGEFTWALLRELELRTSGLVRLNRERRERIGGLLLVVALVVGGFSLPRHPDLAANARWRVSSAMPGWRASGRGFATVDGQIAVFFHTNDEPSPWLILDLGRVATLSYVKVTNRGDCCQDRAVPLVVESSVDGRAWTFCARATDNFYVWDQHFAPRSGRYVRLTVPRVTIFHLASVDVR